MPDAPGGGGGALQSSGTLRHRKALHPRQPTAHGSWRATAPTAGDGSRPLLTNGGGGGGGSLWGCLRTRQPTHPPKLTHPPTHPDPPLPPPGGGGVLLCCKNQLVTQKLCVFGQKKLCHSVTMPSLSSGITELALP